MKESVLHHVWQYRLFQPHGLTTIGGETVEVIDPGKLNTDGGPDFFNAKLKIDNTLWVGNIEIHNQSSDWVRHNHQRDKAYDNVILHIVRKADAEVRRTNGELIPQLELQVPDDIQTRYDELISARKWVACEDKLQLLPAVLISSWKSALLTERFERKTAAVESLLSQSQNHWEEAFYISLARSFGFSTNSQAFETMAKSLPLSVLARHKDNVFQLEALLMGQAGFLEKVEQDEYQLRLHKEYRFLQVKYGLKPMEISQWKLLRLRPDNFPTVRLAQFASLIFRSSKLFSVILETHSGKELRKLFDTRVTEYWQKHYLFGRKSSVSTKKMGEKSIDILLINTVIPFLFAWGKKKNDQHRMEEAIRLLEEIKPENNAIIHRWKERGVTCQSAFDSQALLQLKKNYCEEKKCLQCRIGHKVLTINK